MINNTQPPPRLQYPQRLQLRMDTFDLDSLVDADHQVRAVWMWVEKLDIQTLLDALKARGSAPGRAAIDPRILLCLWLYATLEAVGSARHLAQLCTQHNVYRWIMGGVSVNYHTLSDFRVANLEFLDQLLTNSMAALIDQGLVELKAVAQDGVRVRASAGKSSFRRQAKLTELQQVCRQHVESLKQELDDQPDATTRRQRAARERAQRERQERIEQALVSLDKMQKATDASRAKQSKKPPEESDNKAVSKKQATKNSEKKAPPPRASTTDPDARRMKMANGGTDPAYNIQYVTDTQTKLVVGCEVITAGTDHKAMALLSDQLARRYNRRADAILADGGYLDLTDITAMELRGTTVYLPLKKKDPDAPEPKRKRNKDTPQSRQWRERMVTPQAKQKYQKRAETAEWVNAQARGHGLRLLMVRGVKKVKAIALWHALAINLQTMLRLAIL